MNPFERTARVEVNRHLGVTLEKIVNLKKVFSEAELQIIKRSLEKLKGNMVETKIKMILDIIDAALANHANRSYPKNPPGKYDKKASKLKWVFSEVQLETIVEALNQNPEENETEKTKIIKILEKAVLDSQNTKSG